MSMIIERLEAEAARLPETDSCHIALAHAAREIATLNQQRNDLADSLRASLRHSSNSRDAFRRIADLSRQLRKQPGDRQLIDRIEQEAILADGAYEAGPG